MITNSLKAYKLNYLEVGPDNVFSKLKVVYIADRIRRLRQRAIK